MKNDIDLSIEKLKNAIDKLKEGLNNAKSDLERDGVIQRFEFTFELLWKSAKLILDDSGIKTSSPEEIFKVIYKLGFLDDEKGLLEMLNDRNIMSHTYNKNLAEKVYFNIKEKHIILIEKLFNILKEKQIK